MRRPTRHPARPHLVPLEVRRLPAAFVFEAVPTLPSNPDEVNGPQDVAVADFNKDGVADLAVANAGVYSTDNSPLSPGGNVAILLGDGTGQFPAITNYFLHPLIDATGTRDTVGNAVAIADFNGDGNPDVVVAAGSGGHTGWGLSLFFGDGHGNLGTPKSLDIYEYGAHVLAGDINGDGKADLAFDSGNHLRLILNNGNGTFQNVVTLTNGPNEQLAGFADLNGDGKADMISTQSQESGTTCVVRYASASGLSGPQQVYTGTGRINKVRVADLNGDRRNDLVLETWKTLNGAPDGAVTVLLADNKGGYASPVNYSLPAGTPTGFALGDFNGDGKLDAAVNHFPENTISLLFGNGDGTLRPPLAPSPAGAGLPENLAAADFNGDGKEDLAGIATLTFGVYALLSNPPDIRDSSFQWAADGGVDFGYEITGGDLAQTSTVVLEWATGPTPDLALGGPIYTKTTAKAVGTYGPYHVARSALGARPEGARYLLAVADPDNLASFADADKVRALALPEVALTAFAWSAADKGVQVSYRVDAADLPVASTIAFYWASGTTRGTALGGPVAVRPTETAQGTHGPITLTRGTLGTILAGARYLLAVVDPDNLTSPADPAKVASLLLPSLTVNSPLWDGSGGLSFRYDISTALPWPTTVQVFGATGSTLGTLIDAPLATVTSATAGGYYGPFPVTPLALSRLAAGARTLIVVADREGAFFAPNDPNTFVAIPLPDIAVSAPVWDASGAGVTFTYVVAGAPLTAFPNVSLVWARGTTLATALGPPAFTTSAGGDVGTFPTHVSTFQLGAIPASARYLLAVADPTSAFSPAGRVLEYDETNNVAAAALPVRAAGGPNRFGDYDGDGKTDLAVFRSSNDLWIVRKSSGGNQIFQMGDPAARDVPVPGDYDSDGKADFAIFRPANDTWTIRLSSNGGLLHFQMGDPAAHDVPIPADYDGDGRADLAVFRPTTATWFIRKSGGGTQVVQMGDPVAHDIPVPGDYDGDGKADFAVFRPATDTWIIRLSSGGTRVVQMGDPAARDMPVPGDYDGDGKTDLAIFRPSADTWIVRNSGGGVRVDQHGDPAHGDAPAWVPYLGASSSRGPVSLQATALPAGGSGVQAFSLADSSLAPARNRVTTSGRALVGRSHPRGRVNQFNNRPWYSQELSLRSDVMRFRPPGSLRAFLTEVPDPPVAGGPVRTTRAATSGPLPAIAIAY